MNDNETNAKFFEVIENVENGILSHALPFLDVVSIVDKKIVCTKWRDHCEAAIDSKGRDIKKAFANNEELREKVRQYVKGDHDDIEDIAREFGYPIGKWNVSQVKDFSCTFRFQMTFNEDINSWDVSNATNMRCMFYNAQIFNQNLSNWNVAKVANMNRMFMSAYAFDGDISNWDTSNVTNMELMFQNAKKFKW